MIYALRSRYWGFSLIFAGAALNACNSNEVVDIDSAGQSPCIVPNGAMTSPSTIPEVIQLINELPKPVTLPCFLRALDRPLFINATSSPLSAQPAVGEASPRIFIFRGQLILSVVPAGAGRYLLEMGHLNGSSESVKGELLFPVGETLAPTAASDFIALGNGTTRCSACHAAERAEINEDGDTEYPSRAFQPGPSVDVSLDQLRSTAKACDPNLEYYRCSLLKAIFADDQVEPQSFPVGMPTFSFTF